MYDVSSNARTVITGFRNKDTDELRLTIWSTDTRARTYLRVTGAESARLTYNGLIVSRWPSNQLFSRTGKLLQTYKDNFYLSAISPDGRKILADKGYQNTGEHEVEVRAVDSGELLSTEPAPAGHTDCTADRGYVEESIMTCGAGSLATSYAVRYDGVGEPRPVATYAEDTRIVADGTVHHTPQTSDDFTPRPTWTRKNGEQQRIEVALKVGPWAAFASVGAYGDEVLLLDGPNLDGDPFGSFVKKTLSTGEEVALAGPASAIGGYVTSAVVVDGS